MKHILLFFFFTLSVGYIAGQPLQKYQGKLQNGFTDAGEVTYSYKVDEKTREHIRQGTFRYAVKAKDDAHRFNHSITGSYANNLKDGLWSIKINQKDYRLQDPARYTTGTITMEGMYALGLPNGAWRYESLLKSRTGEKKQDKWTWGKHDSLQTVIVELNFTSGLITGPFYAKNDRAYEVRGSFDTQGFFDGEWTWRYPDSTIVVTWDHGIEVKMLVTDPEGNTLHLVQQTEAARTIRALQSIIEQGGNPGGAFPFSLDTVSLLANQKLALPELLQQTLYHQQYFLYRQIEGDKGVYFDKQNYRMKFNIKGMYVVKPINRISGTQVQHYSRIESLITRMEAQMAYIYQMKRDGKLKKQAGDAIRLMEYNLTKARRYACTGETIKLYLSLDEGITRSESNCSYLPASLGTLPVFKTKDEALQYFATKVAEIEKENQIHYTNIRKNLIL